MYILKKIKVKYLKILPLNPFHIYREREKKKSDVDDVWTASTSLYNSNGCTIKI